MRVSLSVIMIIFVIVLPWTAPPIAAQGGIVIDAVDNNPDNKLWNCETNRVPFGNEQVDRSRCFSFRYQVPPEGIKSATLHVSISTLGANQETDSTVVAVGESFSDCAWATGGMAGCIGLHGGFEGPHRSLNLNLLDIACDPSAQGSPEKQQALIEQLQTGVLHFLLQDDTAVYGAKLVLNGGPPTVACGTSEQPVSEVLPGGEQPSGEGGSTSNLRCGLGQFWDVVDTDGEWIGVWTRRGDSNIFDGRWKQPGYQDVIATLTIQISGNQVTVERQDIGDPNNFGVTGCTYEGTLAADGVSVSGSAICTTRSGRRTPPVSWSATINCEPSSGSASTSGPEGPAAPGTPWETPAGQNCFEQWIREAMSRLNAYDDGGDDFNARKPWSINQYGILEGNPRIGPTSVAAPDNFADYNYNKYWWMWDQYPAESVSDWRLPEWRAAQVPPLRPYVRNCVGEAGGTDSTTGVVSGVAPGSTGTSAVPGDDVTPPDFGSPEPASVSRMTLQAGQRQVVEGQLVNVPVWLLNGADVANINSTVGYNASVATPEGDLIKGNLLDNALFSANTGDTGIIRAGFAQTSGIDGTGTVAYIPFRAVGQPGDRTALDVAVSTINDPDGTVLTIDRIDGQILIVGADGVTPGDCDGDGALTEVDALCALQMSVQLIPERLVLDLDTDSQVTSRDSVIILQGAIGK